MDGTPGALPETMMAWSVRDPGPISGGPLEFRRVPRPGVGPGELLVRVDVCGVCRTDLHVAEGDLPVRRPGVIPGHEIVGTVVAVGATVDAAGRTAADQSAGDQSVGDQSAGGWSVGDQSAGGWSVGDRVGAAWLRSTCGECRFCRRGDENLCPGSRYHGWDADGGYAEYVAVPAAFAYRLPAGYTDAELAPLMCAGIIGFRALRRSGLRPGGRLGVYGFGGSAHLAAQIALAEGATVHVLTRGAAARRLALGLGAASAGDAYDAPPEPLDAAILFAPVGDLVPVAMRALDRGGVLAVAGIHLSDIPPLVYERDLFYEREIRSVTSNTRADGAEFLRLAGVHRLRVTTHQYPLPAADRALADLAAGRFDGAAVLVAPGAGEPATDDRGARK